MPEIDVSVADSGSASHHGGCPESVTDKSDCPDSSAGLWLDSAKGCVEASVGAGPEPDEQPTTITSANSVNKVGGTLTTTTPVKK